MFCVELFDMIGRLKRVQRQGWVDRNVTSPESVADHSHRVAMLCLLCPDTTLDKNKMVAMALVHDLAEVHAGDITPFQGISHEEKHKMEVDGMDKFQECMTRAGITSNIRQLWEEYEAGATPEAQFVKQADKLEMVLQARAYQREQPELNLNTFYETTKGKITHPWLKVMDDHVR
eukprot:PhF_6_TR28226/c0_g1_i2/m.41758/K07023/K07023; putative hydrolases of HD superfamily